MFLTDSENKEESEDGKCLLYAFLAALDPLAWDKIPKSETGQILDRRVQIDKIKQANGLLNLIAFRMDHSGLHAQAQRLRNGGYPGAEELGHYAEVFGGSIVVHPASESAYMVPLIYGKGKVIMEVKHYYMQHNSGEHGAGHYELLRSWFPVESARRWEYRMWRAQQLHWQYEGACGELSDEAYWPQSLQDSGDEEFARAGAESIQERRLQKQLPALNEQEMEDLELRLLEKINSACWEKLRLLDTEEEEEEEEESSDDEHHLTPLYGLLGSKHKKHCPEQTCVSEQKEEDAYNKDLPYLDLPDEDFLEDIKMTQWHRHADDILQRAHYTSRVLERLCRLSTSTHKQVWAQLRKLLAPEAVHFLKQTEESIAKQLVEEEEAEAKRWQSNEDPIDDDKRPFDVYVFEDLPRLREALETKSWRLILPALSYMSKMNKEDEALGKIFEAAGEQTCLDLLDRLRAAQRQETSWEQEAASYYNEAALARGQFPDGPAEDPAQEEDATADAFYWHVLDPEEPVEEDQDDQQYRQSTNKLCANNDCPFSLRVNQARAERYRGKGADGKYCLMCSQENIQCADRSKRGKTLLECLCKLSKFSQVRLEKGLERVAGALSEEKAQQYANRVAAKCSTKSAVMSKDWATALQKRQYCVQERAEERAAYCKQATKDYNRVCKKFPHVFGPDAVPGNSWMTERAKAFEEWCLTKSWRMCSKCNRMVFTKLRASHLAGKDRTKAQFKHCAFCKTNGAEGYPVKQPSDVPDTMAGMPQAVLDSLSLIDVDTGYEFHAPNGYRMHTAMTRLRWKAQSLEENIHKLPRDQRKLARKAARKLVNKSPESSYKKFYLMHTKYVEKRKQQIEKGELSEDAPVERLPIRFMEAVGIECAIWPHLYWETTMCETYVRSQDSRRLRKRKRSQVDDEPEKTSSDSEREDVAETGQEEEEAGSHQSTKASFLAKVLGPVLGYGNIWELFQFQYDLWLATTIGGARNSAGISTRAAMSGKSLSPEYWRKFHMALVDLQEQIGFPHFFLTISIYEWSAPYHEWLQDEMEKLCRNRLKLPIAETLHIANILSQAVKGLLTGANEGQNIRSEHIFAAEGDTSKRTIVNWVAWLKFILAK